MQKGYTPHWSEQMFVIKKVKNIVLWKYIISEETFYEKELQKTNQTEIRVEKVINRKGDKLYVKLKGYDNSFNSWVDKKDIVIQNELFSRTIHL